MTRNVTQSTGPSSRSSGASGDETTFKLSHHYEYEAEFCVTRWVATSTLYKWVHGRDTSNKVCCVSITPGYGVIEVPR